MSNIFPLIVVFTTVLINQSYSEICENKAALTTIEASVHRKRNVGRENFNGSFYDLDKNFTLIDVTRANVTHLCEGMIKNFYRVEFLSLINVNLSKIDPGAFQNVPRLKQLSLAVNHLKTIYNGVFNVVPSLQVIYLSNNEIESIAHGAFSEMPHLKAVHLNHNKLTDLTGNLFFGSPKINLVDYSFNQIKDVGERSFDDIRPEDATKLIHIYVKRNQIETVSRDAIEKLTNPVNLHLQGNSIAVFSDIVFTVKEKSEIYLDDNLIECIPDDVLDEILAKPKKVQVKNSPIDCKCLDRIDNYLAYEEMKGEIVYESKFPCRSFSNFI